MKELTAWIIFAAGPAALVASCVVAYRKYLHHKSIPEPKPKRSGLTLVIVVVGVALFSWPIAAIVGVSAACLIPGSGNLCGLLGLVGVAPLFSAAAIVGTAHQWAAGGRQQPNNALERP